MESLFDFYVEWDESDHHRSMRLVLDVIIQLLKENPDAEAANATRHKLLTSTVSIIIGTVTKPAAKSALKTLDYFLTKGVLTVDGLKSFYVACRPSPSAEAQSEPDLEPWRSFFGELFHWTGLHFVSQTAGKLMVTLYLGLRLRGKTTDSVLPIQTWLDWLLPALKDDPTLLETMKIYFFFPLFKADSEQAIMLLQTVMNREAIASEDLSLDIPALLRLVVLETGKKVGLVEEPELSTEQQPTAQKASSLVLDERLLATVLGHPSHEVRSLAISLLITTPSTTKPYSVTALGLLQQHLGAYFADPDAKFRVDVMAKAREMFKRVRGAICILMRSLSKLKAKEAKARSSAEQKQQPAAQQPAKVYRSNVVALPEEGLAKCLDDHIKFLRWYIGFLLSELTPTASYQRHVASLKATTWIIRMEGEKSKKWETQDDQTLLFDLFDETWSRALSDLVMDSFEDVREFTSANIRALIEDGRYRKFSRTEPVRQIGPEDELTDLLRRAEDVARRTSRADHSDGAARVCQLVYRFSSTTTKRVSFMTGLIEGLEKKLTVASTNLAAAVLDAPVHGDFSALRFVWQAASEMRFEPDEIQAFGALEERVVACCERVWAVVQDILCDDSPEGHLPEELEDVDGLNTKDVLSYSFRAIHESRYVR